LNEVPQPDAPLTTAELTAVAALTPAQLSKLDETLLANTNDRWRKVAMVIAKSFDFADLWPGVPDSFYAERIRALVAQGLLESQGNLMYMRFSEVRRPTPTSRP
jgi:Protein of unknown function